MTLKERIEERIERKSVRHLTRLAALLALAGLAIMVYSVVSPRALPVMLAMSAGHVVGIAAFFCYLLAVLLDVARSTPAPDSLRPGARELPRPPPPPSSRRS